VKAAAGLVAVLAVGLTRSPGVLALAGTGLLAILALQEARVIALALRAGLAAGALAVVMLAPAAFLGPVPAAGRLLAKVLLTTVTVRLVAATTGWPALASVLRRLGLPDAFLLVLDLALKYLALLGAFALALLEALRLRAVGRQRRGTAALGAVAGTLFLKSLDQAAALHDAMRCRGFTGRYRPAARLRLGVRELALGGAAGALAVASILGRT
jgi:cobalt/nickel transport system permease protein